MSEGGADRALVGLVCDIGGTNARFAIARVTASRTDLAHVMSLPGKAYATVEAAARAYMDATRPLLGVQTLDAAVAACAGPVVDGTVSFTNLPWTTTGRSFGAAVGLPEVHLINDLEAVAWAAPVLESSGLRRIAHTGALMTPPPAIAGAGRTTRAILNAGTGCGASAFVRNESGTAVVVGEYGHTSYAPLDAMEVQVWQRLHARFGRVSIERLLSGPGVLNLYVALCEIEGVAAVCDTPAGVNLAGTGGDGTAERAVSLFCDTLGSVAGDMALCFGARGGIFLVGGVAAMLMTEARDTRFRQRFEDKGRFRTYLADIPTLLIRDGNVALLGAARAMARAGK